MIAQLWNRDWLFRGGSVSALDGSPTLTVTLPHDAMILTERSPDTANSGNTGYYPGSFAEYRKCLYAPESWRGKTVFLEFDGIFCDAHVYINGALAARRFYGYSQFAVCLNDWLHYGDNNELRVTADTSPEEQSRWYTGTGIYRDVKLYVGGSVFIPLHGLKIETESVAEDYARMKLQVALQNQSERARRVSIRFEVVDPNGASVCFGQSDPISVDPGSTTAYREWITIPAPMVWDCEAPNLYCIRAWVTENGEQQDEAAESFGIRTLALDSISGLRINGKEIKLRGACIHHDLGILGAADFAAAEERRIRQLKDAGFNCVRCAHNPAGPRLLEVCDRLGMLVMDEAFDMWTEPKCRNDYANHFQESWEEDIRSMAEKDYNHPSVILYSVGNEITEIGTPLGAAWNSRLAAALRSVDKTRYITNSVNGMIVLMDQLDHIIPEILEQLGPESSESDGSNDLNNIVSLCVGQSGDLLFGHPLIGERTEDVYANLDIAGMNYMTCRFEPDHLRYPERVMLSTESFPGDLVRIWTKVQENPHVIGDMTWAGYDYLGETGGGLFRYDGSPVFDFRWPMRSSNMGDLNLIGSRRPISYLREIVYGLRKEPYIAVDKPEHYGQTSTPNPWTLHDDIASWSWPGYEGKPVIVRVYSAAEEVELFLNGKSLGRKAAGSKAGCEADFELLYSPGVLEAVDCSEGAKTGSCTLRSVSGPCHLSMTADKSTLRAGEEDLCFLLLRAVDETGTLCCGAARDVQIQVSGAGSLQAFGSANPVCEGNYFDQRWQFYEGELLAVIRAGMEPGDICVRASAEDLGQVQLTIHVS